MDFYDLFSGGSSNNGDATSDGAGDGEKGKGITDYLSALTGAYDSITGQGEHGGPAPAAQVAKPAATNTNYLLIGGGAILVVILLLVFLKRK